MSQHRVRRLTGRLPSVVLLACVACSSLPEPPWTPVVRREPQADLLHYEIQVDVDHEAGYVRGQVGIEFRALPGAPLREITLDAVGLAVLRAWDSQGRDLAVDVDRQTLRVHLAEPLPPGSAEIAVVDYEGFPRRGLTFVPPGGVDPGRAWQVWSQGQPEDTRHWIPVWDLPNDRATHTLRVTVDDDFLTLAAGELVDTVRDDRRGRRTDTWHMAVPHSSYLVTLVAGGFGRAELPGDGVPLPVLSDARLLDDAVRISERTREMLALFERVTGLPYPYSKYAQTYVEDYTAGGMENISATTLYEEGIHPAEAEPQVDIDGLLAHELAHQWYGDLVTNTSWADSWLNEGLATYCEMLWTEQRLGRDHLLADLLDAQRAGMAADLLGPRATVYADYADPDEMFDARAYEGAAARLFLLRNQLGADAFDRALRRYTAEHARGLVVTADFVRSFQDELQRDLQPFFDEWFLDGGFPIFDVRVVTSAGDGAPWLEVEQVQDREDMREVFHVAVAVSWSRGGQEHRGALALESRTATLPLAGEGELDWVRFDADTAVPGRILAHQTPDQWASQLSDASDAVTRLLAAQWFARDAWVFTPSDDGATPRAGGRAALLRAAREDAFLPVRTTAIAALAPLAADDVTQALLALAADPDARVRQAAVEALATRESDEVLAVLDAASLDENGGVCGAAVAAIVARGMPNAFDLLFARFEATRQVRLQRDLVALAGDVDDPRALPFVIGVARSHPERWVRTAAVRQLGRDGWRFPDVVFRQLCRSLHDESYEVRQAAAEALGRQGDAGALPHLRARLDLEDDASVRRSLVEALGALD